MKTILCYGDSNTWGFDPVTKKRFPHDTRWPGVLRNELGAGYQVLEEGLNGRTTVFNDPVEPYRNGLAYLTSCLLSHQPIDLVIIMLGTNDTKKQFAVSASEIAKGMEMLIRQVEQSGSGRDGSAPQILLIVPALIKIMTGLSDMFECAPKKSAELANYYEALAKQYGCSLLDCTDIISSSEIDGIHLEASEHLKLGNAVSQQVRSILSTNELGSYHSSC